MDLDRTPATIADAAAEEVRALAHTTHPFKAPWRQPSEISDTVQNTALIVDRLPQVLQQLSQGLQGLHEKGAVRADDGGDAGERVAAARRELESVWRALQVLQEPMRRATAHLSHLGGYLDDDSTDEA